MTALHIAIQAGVTDVGDVLLANGAPTSIKTADGDTAAHLAARYKQWQVLRKLQDYGAVLDAEGLDKLKLEEYQLEELELEELEILTQSYWHTLHKSRVSDVDPIKDPIHVSDGGRLSIEENIKHLHRIAELERLTYHLSHRHQPTATQVKRF